MKCMEVPLPPVSNTRATHLDRRRALGFVKATEEVITSGRSS